MRIMLEFGVCRILHINGDSEAERDFLAEFTGDMRVQRTEEGLAVYPREMDKEVPVLTAAPVMRDNKPAAGAVRTKIYHAELLANASELRDQCDSMAELARKLGAVYGKTQNTMVAYISNHEDLAHLREWFR